MCDATISQAQQYQAAGQKAYRKRDYNAALSDFSQALALSPPKELEVSILDNRAAVLEKLGLAAATAATATSSTSSASTAAASANATTEAQRKYFRLALRDAHAMVAELDCSPTGYLRAGKLLQLTGQWDGAVEMYKLGMDKCSNPDAKRMLGKMHGKVLDRLNSWRSALRSDPLGRLPAEIVGMVFTYFPFKDLMLLQRVSRPWRNFIISYRPAYATLDLSKAKRRIPKSTIDTYLTRANGSTTRALLNEADGRSVVTVVTRCRMLSELTVLSSIPDASSLRTAMGRATNLTSLSLHCPIPSSLLASIIKRSEKLQSLYCGQIGGSGVFLWDSTETRGLKMLVLMWGRRYPAPSGLGKMLECLPELRELKLNVPPTGLSQEPADFSFLTQLEALTFSATDAQHPPRVPDSLRRLNISHNSWMQFDRVVDPLPAGLEFLSVAQSPSITNRVLLRLLSAAAQRGSSLSRLEVGMCPRIDLDSLDWLLDAGHGSNLEFLSVAGSPTFGDQVTKELGRMAKLKVLDMGLTRISGVGLLNLISREGSVLERVRVVGCPNLGYDAIQAARDRGIRVLA